MAVITLRTDRRTTQALYNPAVMAQRDLLKIIFQNFLKSLRPRQFTGTYMGTDLFGNKYFEKAADPAGGRRKAARYFEPPEKSDFEHEQSPEWEAWLRGRRKEAPSMDEVQRNEAFKLMKQKKAHAIKAGHKQRPDNDNLMVEAKRGAESFPTYGDEYEVSAGYKSKDSSWKR